MRTLLVATSLVLLTGCFLHHARPGEKLSKTVQELNKSARWGQIGAAAQMVEVSYRERFLATHRHWGRTVEIADTEIVHMEVAAGSESAIAMVAYSWYSTDAMTLHGSLVRQTWVAEDQNFALISETVIDGDPRLLKATAQATDPGMVQPMNDPLSSTGDAKSSEPPILGAEMMQPGF
jgi:hypothetical protein